MSSPAPPSTERDLSQCTRTGWQTHVYDHTWEQVVSSYMLRFPKHPRLPVLLNSEVTADITDTSTGVRTITRRVVLDVEAPVWLKRTIGISEVIFYQFTAIDFQKRSMKIHNINETGKDRASFGDDCEYRADDKDPSKTYFEQRAFFLLPRIPLAKSIEKLMAKNYEKHTGEGRHIDAEFCVQAIESGYYAKLCSEQGGISNMPLEQSKLKVRKVRKSKGSKENDSTRAESEQNGIQLLRKASIKSVAASVLPGMVEMDFSSHYEASLTFFGVLLAIALLPLFIHLRIPLIVSIVSVSLTVILLNWHHARYPEFWLGLFRLHHPTHTIFKTQSYLADDPSVEASRESIVAELEHIPASTVSSASNMPSIPVDLKLLTEQVAAKANDLPPLLTFNDSKQTPSATKMKKTTVVISAAGSPVDSKRGAQSDGEYLQDEDDNISSDGETEKEPASTQGDEYEEEDDEFEDDEPVHSDDDLDEDLTQFLLQTQVENDQDLGSELSTVKLSDLVVEIPAFIDKVIFGNNLINFIMVVKFPNGAKRTVERQYTDFVRLQKFLFKTVPQCKVQLQPSSVPKRKQSNQTAIGHSLDLRREILQTYIGRLLKDEAVNKLAHRVMLVFVKQRSMLFSKPGIGNRKRFFNTSFSGSSAVIEVNSPSFKNGVLMKLRWRSCLQDTKVSLDKVAAKLNLFCNSQKLPHCAIAIEDIEDIVLYGEDSSSDTIPFMVSDRFWFFEIRTSIKDSYYFAASKDIVLDWFNELTALHQQRKQESPKQSTLAPPAFRHRLSILESSGSDKKLILNRKKVLFDKSLAESHPCKVSKDLLDTILELFQDYTNNKCIYIPQVIQKVQNFADKAAILQLVDKELLSTHSEMLSFYFNIYHTLVVHSHLELGFGPSPTSSKKLKLIFRTVCYDIGNQIFSIQDIEHSILRAKMSRPITMNNSFFSQLLIPRFNKRDPRKVWALTQPDLRINFALNSGTKSSIYNIWSFDSEPNLLNQQLDHASTHFLNEQVTVDYDKAIIFLPRICQYYSNDLGGTKQRMLKTLMRYMSSAMVKEVKQILRNAKSRGQKVKIRYAEYEWSVRGVFFKGHDIVLNQPSAGCPLLPFSSSGYEDTPLSARSTFAS